MATYRPITEDELSALQRACHGPYAARERAFYALVFYTGLQPGQCLKLRFKDVCRHLQVVGRILGAEDGAMDGVLKGREVALEERSRRALERWVDQVRRLGFYHPNRLLFLDVGRRDYAITANFAWRQFKEAAARAGIEGPVSLHSLRKAYIICYCQRTQYAFAKLKKNLGFASRRNAKRAYKGAVQAYTTNELQVAVADGGGEGGLAHPVQVQAFSSRTQTNTLKGVFGNRLRWR